MEKQEEYILEMQKAGLQYGHKHSRTHPQAKFFILKTQNNSELINLEETAKRLDEAKAFISQIMVEQNQILFVATTSTIKANIKELTLKFKQPYVIERWLGGTLTNFKTINNRINYLLDLKNKLTSGQMEKYTKKEKLEIDKEIKALDSKFSGLIGFNHLPKALFIIDPMLNQIAVKEAKKMKIPVVAVLDTDDDPTLIDYPIPANDSSRPALTFILKEIEKAILEGKEKAVLKEKEKEEQKLTEIKN